VVRLLHQEQQEARLQEVPRLELRHEVPAFPGDRDRPMLPPK
jgi:hypothetical protein